LPSELQFRVLRLLESNPHLSQRELSKSLGVSLGGINYCLNALVAKGSIKIQNFKNNQNKWVYAYLLTPQGIAEKTSLTSGFLKRKMQEYHQLKVEIEALSQEMKLHETNESHLTLEVDESAAVAEVVIGIPETHGHGIGN
jgi:EPS-associated MarR family transcriptional regulator